MIPSQITITHDIPSQINLVVPVIPDIKFDFNFPSIIHIPPINVPPPIHLYTQTSDSISIERVVTGKVQYRSIEDDFIPSW